MKKRTDIRNLALRCTLLVFTVLMICFGICGCNQNCAHEYHSKITLAAECEKEGTRTFTCALCDHVYTEAISATGHQYDGGTQTKDPNCFEPGTVTYTCNSCGSEKYEPIEMTEHSYGEPHVTLAATCGAEGEISVSCTVCSATKVVEKIPKTGEHIFENTVVREPTCTDPGEGLDTCTICGYSEPTSYEVTDHEYDAGQVIVQPGCTSAGKKEHTCIHCGHTREAEVSPKGHTWETGNCTTPVTCKVCNAVNPDDDGHEYELVSKRKASDNFAGMKKYQCKHCGEKKTEYFGKDGAYDFQAIIDKASEYAEELGFNVIVWDYQDGVVKRFSSIFVMIDHYQGQQRLENEALKLVQYHYEEKLRENRDPGKFNVWIIVTYPEWASVGTGYFNIYVCCEWVTLMD